MKTKKNVKFLLNNMAYWQEIETGRPRAICGQRYPFPCFEWLWIGVRGSRAAAPKGTKSCRTQGDFRSFVSPSVCSSIRPPLGPLRPEICLGLKGLKRQGECDGHKRAWKFTPDDPLDICLLPKNKTENKRSSRQTYVPMANFRVMWTDLLTSSQLS